MPLSTDLYAPRRRRKSWSAAEYAAVRQVQGRGNNYFIYTTFGYTSCVQDVGCGVERGLVVRFRALPYLFGLNR